MARRSFAITRFVLDCIARCNMSRVSCVLDTGETKEQVCPTHLSCFPHRERRVGHTLPVLDTAMTRFTAITRFVLDCIARCSMSRVSCGGRGDGTLQVWTHTLSLAHTHTRTHTHTHTLSLSLSHTHTHSRLLRQVEHVARFLLTPERERERERVRLPEQDVPLTGAIHRTCPA